MKRILLLSWLVMTLACCTSPQKKIESEPLPSQTSEDTLQEISENLSNTQNWKIWEATIQREFMDASLFATTDTIAADFNGDAVMDRAWISGRQETSGIVIQLVVCQT